MILAVFDDLFFSIKIKKAAKLLDSVKMRPLAATQADPALNGVPTLGFVSHVHATIVGIPTGIRAIVDDPD